MLLANPRLELGATSIADFFSAQPDALAEADDQARTRAQLEGFQRLMLLPLIRLNARTAPRLALAGITSAGAIADASSDELIAAIAGAMPASAIFTLQAQAR